MRSDLEVECTYYKGLYYAYKNYITNTLNMEDPAYCDPPHGIKKCSTCRRVAADDGIGVTVTCHVCGGRAWCGVSSKCIAPNLTRVNGDHRICDKCVRKLSIDKSTLKDDFTIPNQKRAIRECND
jgi:hypothetical protein